LSNCTYSHFHCHCSVRSYITHHLDHEEYLETNLTMVHSAPKMSKTAGQRQPIHDSKCPLRRKYHHATFKDMLALNMLHSLSHTSHNAQPLITAGKGIVSLFACGPTPCPPPSFSTPACSSLILHQSTPPFGLALGRSGCEGLRSFMSRNLIIQAGPQECVGDSTYLRPSPRTRKCVVCVKREGRKETLPGW
jgi:hypothetical protein